MPPKHKERNTIRFLPFAERIASINVDVIHRIGHRNEETADDDIDSYFHQCLEKWNDLNCSQGWNEFRSEVKDVQTLAQLVLLRDRVVASLLNHLDKKDPLTVQSLLDMVVALARDLRQDFYPYYPDFLSKIVSFLNCKEAEVLEWSFHCLAYLFKFLWRCMVRNIGPVLSSLLPLLSSKRQKYIHFFAADSFAFLARKVKDQTAFLKLMLCHLEEQPEDSEGCGRLIFSWLKGIKNQLHSCSQNTLLIIMQSMGNDLLPTDTLLNLFSHTLSHLVVEIHPGGLVHLWEAIQVSMKQFYAAWKSGKRDASDAILRVLKVVHQLCDHCEAIHVTSPNSLVDLILSIYASPSQLPDVVLSELSAISAVLLMSPTVCLPQDRTVKLSSKVLAMSPPHIILAFLKKVISWSALDTLVLPRLLEIVTTSFICSSDDGLGLQILAQLAHVRVPLLCQSYGKNDSDNYLLDFTSASLSAGCSALDISRKLLAILENFKQMNANDHQESFNEMISALRVIPHVRPINETDVQSMLQKLLLFLCQEIKATVSILKNTNGANELRPNTERLLSQLLLLFVVSLEAVIKIQESTKGLASVLSVNFMLESLLPPSQGGPSQLGALRAVNLYLENADLTSIKDSSSFSLSIYESLKMNLTSPFHSVREMTCRILCQLPLAPELQSMFGVCLEAENTAATITAYRDKLQYFQKLSFDVTQSTLIRYPSYRFAPFYFILGSLYVNFQLLWEPLQLLVASYANSMTPAEFWPVFHGQLTLATNQRDYSPLQGIALEVDFNSPLVNELYSSLNSVDDKPDHAHYRLLLWQTTHYFPEVCEKKNRDIASYFLTFMQEEYYRSNAEVASVWDIKKHNNEDISVEESNLDNDSDNENENAEEDERGEDVENDTINNCSNADTKKIGKKKKSESDPDLDPHADGKPSVRLLTKTLLAQLGLLSKMRAPLVMYREPELNRVYNDLLSHKNPDIQKAALECVLTYKHKYLVPYSQHLFSLIDNKSFKNEVTKFRIDKDSGIIQEEHRPQLIPIIMRLVYSKMVAKTGMRTGGKAGPAMRRALVFRFLAGCHEDEMLIFVKMAFRFFDPYLEGNLDQMVDSIQSNIDLEKVIPPRRLQSVVNLLSVVQERFGGLMGNRLLSLILQLLTCVGATVDGILQKRDEIHIGFLNILRGLRTSCIEVLTQFFDRFEAYPWSLCEMNTVLRVFVFPLVDRLPLEGVHSPTALMKLFVVWSQHPRYFILFGTHPQDSTSTNPLAAIIKLLLVPKTNQTVCGSIMEILENLLTLKDHKQIDETDMEVDETYLEERAPVIQVSNVLSLNEHDINALNLSQEVNLGSKLLFPHIRSILERFRMRLAANVKRGSGLNKQELLVLSYVSEFVRAPDTSAILAQLILPILTRRISTPHEDEENVLKMMNTLNHLVKNVEDPHIYVRPIAALFSCVNGVAGRKMLISLINTIAESTGLIYKNLKEEMECLSSVASNLNAYDKRWVEQPDFDKRLDAFKKVQILLDEGKLTVDLGVIVIHHCFYVIRSDKDMSLRDSAAHCLRRVAPSLSLQFRSDEVSCKFLIDTTILSLIRNSINKDSNENLHSEGVLLLGEMARECGMLHPVLRDLSLLTNKFCEVFEALEKMPTIRTLTQFILPLVSQFISSEKYASKNSLVDAAIKAVSVVSRLLPWHQYEALLRYYLGRLRMSSVFQKQLVRIVMNILDAFHFDLSKAQVKRMVGEQAPSSSQVSPVAKEKVNDAGPLSSSEDLSNQTIETGNSTLDDLVEEMDVEETGDEIEMDTEESEPQQMKLAVEKQVVLCPSAATRVIQTITCGLLPQLHRALVARTLIESVHKVNKKQIRNTYHDRDAEEEEVLRVPMALAVVKLLQRLPKEMLIKNLPGVLVKLCTFLKSRLDSVRRVTRETLQKVMVSLGPSFLGTLLKEMTTLLTRGFQVHVLVFSIHSVLISLKEVFKAGDIDESLPYIIEVCKLDLFGAAAEEKEEGKIASKLHEAQSTKSYNTLHVTAQFVSESHLTNLLIPFKEIIQSAHSHKIVNKASECLRQIVSGLSENALVSPSGLLIFAVGVASECIPALSLKQQKSEKTMKQKEIEARRRPDCFIIKEAPKQRTGITSSDAARVAARMNAHLFVEFGLRLIYFLLKHEKLKESGEDVRPLIDPIIPLFKSCLSSEHVKLSIISLQCLSWLLRIDLPSLRNNIAEITSSIFGLLHKFAAAGLSKGDNFDLVVAAFKAVAVLVRDVKYHTLSQDQLKALLLYAEQDLSDANKHATAFALLKAILSRKLVVPEIHDVMDKVATLSITSDLPHVRVQARVVFHQFLMEYPLGKKLEGHLSFYLSQLNYELQPGRESALEMVNSVISSFPVNILSKHAGLFFLMLGARLVNDDAPECRKMVAQCINKMLGRLSKNDRDRLFNISLLWLRDKQVSHRRLAAQLCGIFVVCEKESFRSHLPDLLPAVIAQFSYTANEEDKNEPGKFVRAPSKAVDTLNNKQLTLEEPESGTTCNEMQKKISETEKMRDHHVYQTLQLVIKICNHCPEWLSQREFSDHVYNLTEHAQALLAHPHEWVRLSAAQILTYILNSIDMESLSSALNDASDTPVKSEGKPNLGFFVENAVSKLRSMILDHCAQFTPGIEVGQLLLLQVVKNLVIFADILKNTSGEELASGLSEINDKQKPLSLLWLVKRMRRIVNMEVVHAPKSTLMRTMVLNWTGAVVVKLGSDYVRPVLHHLLAPIVREQSSDEPALEGSPLANLRTLAKEVGSLIKKTVGHEYFIRAQTKLQTQIMSVRAERKMKRKHEAVAEPEKAAKRKIQKQAKKKESNKRRLLKLRGKKFKGKREVSLEDD
ncbi:Small subunit processome component 20-like protein [Frankliniella fusca]|uniref:Small subunit processome component 20-like protein n=1 Tax=Frankliniella fusca TaxID=407009 RepID=A0AAE1I2B3_9NEOP|nr:Small subunit processome component 20-like protein [Frankliniella fusca]